MKTIETFKAIDYLTCKSGKIETANEALELLGSKAYYKGVLTETEEQMEIVENDNQSTIELMDEGESIFSNGTNDT